MNGYKLLLVFIGIIAYATTLTNSSPAAQQEHILIGPEDENPALAGEPIDDNETGPILKITNCEKMMRRLVQAMADKETHCSMQAVKPEMVGNMTAPAVVANGTMAGNAGSDVKPPKV